MYPPTNAIKDARFSWHEALGITPSTNAGSIRRAMAWLALIHHPDKDGSLDQMKWVTSPYYATPQAASGNGQILQKR